jgi:oligopeptidase B
VSDEQRCAPVANPTTFTVIAPRERDFLYGADHVGNRWVIRTNWNAPNYRLMTVADSATGAGKTAWRDVVPHDAKVFIEGVQPFDNYLAIEERSGGNKRLRLLGNDGKSSFVEADEPAYSMGLSTNAETGTDWVRYTYNSLTTLKNAGII